MFPIGDDNSDRHIQPIVNYAFIAVNVLVFLLLQQLGGNDAFTYAFSLVPREITTGTDITGIVEFRDAAGKILGEVQHYSTPLPVYFNFLSSMFMHGDIMHIFGNLMFLWLLVTILRTCSATCGMPSFTFCAELRPHLLRS